eukprot:scaffold229884_cov47-Attheya_sp.AAC.1
MAIKLQRTFEVIRVQQAKGDFEEALRVTHIPSAKENVEGFDISPLLENKLQLAGKVERQRHIQPPTSRERIDWTNAVQSWLIIDRRRIERNREDENQCHKRQSEEA